MNRRQEVLNELEEIEAILCGISEAVETGQIADKELLLLTEDIKALEKRRRILKSEIDVLFFAYEYFSFDTNPENENNLIPEGVGIEFAPDFHIELCGKLDEVALINKTKRIGWSCPRGHGKSAYLSNIFPIHQIVFNLRKYIVIISETQSMSQKFVEWIADQLKFNQKLREDFGELLSQKKILNQADNLDGFITHNNIRVQSSSIGKQLRGARHGAYRPDLVILDDLESLKNTNTKELRDKNLHWFNSVIRPIGDPKRTAFIYMGTLVHGLGLLPTVLKMSDFDSKIYSAIVSEPERQDLWAEVEEMLRNQEDPNRLEKAEDFYFQHKEEMEMGVQVLWKGRFTYFDLMKIKVDVGSRAFGSEYLNRPTDDENAIFKQDMFLYFEDKDLFDIHGRPLNLQIFGFWDIALGKSSRSDYNAIVTIGIDRRTGVIYVLDAWAKKCKMHEALEIVVEKILQYEHHTFAVETIQAQYDAFRQLRERMMKLGYYKTRVKAVNPKTKKEMRIEQLEPLFENGAVRLKRNQRLLIEMLEQFPNHDHDDLPDALASVVELIGATRKRTFYNKPKGF